MKVSMRVFYTYLLMHQGRWIASCHAGKSYTGKNGRAIMDADYAEFKRIKARLASMRIVVR